jgi:hypothetical protein
MTRPLVHVKLRRLNPVGPIGAKVPGHDDVLSLRPPRPHEEQPLRLARRELLEVHDLAFTAQVAGINVHPVCGVGAHMVEQIRTIAPMFEMEAHSATISFGEFLHSPIMFDGHHLACCIGGSFRLDSRALCRLLLPTPVPHGAKRGEHRHTRDHERRNGHPGIQA